MTTHSSILAWRIPMDRGAWQATVHEVSKSRTQLKQHPHITDCVSWVPRLTLLDLTNWAYERLVGRDLVCR